MVKYLKYIRDKAVQRQNSYFHDMKIRKPIYEVRKEVNLKKIAIIIIIIMAVFLIVYKVSHTARRHIDKNLISLFDVMETNNFISSPLLDSTRKPETYISLKEKYKGEDGFMLKTFKKELAKDYIGIKDERSENEILLDKLNQDIPNRQAIVDAQHEEEKKSIMSTISDFFMNIGQKLSSKHQLIGT